MRCTTPLADSLPAACLALAAALVGCGSPSSPGSDPARDPAPGLPADVTSPADVPPEVAEDPLPDIPAAGPPDVRACTSDCGDTVPVEAATFAMGCVAVPAPGPCAASEQPSHEVAVPAFAIDVTEVTVDLYARCVGDGACTLPNRSSTLCAYGEAGLGGHPVNCVERQQAAAFCAWAGKRLCTEAEWELAAVGATGKSYPWGDAAPTCQVAVIDEGGFGCGTQATFPVGSKPDGRAPCGAQDMLGNVWEWVADDWHDSYDGAPADGSAWIDGTAGAFVARGGAFSDRASVVRASVRRKFDTHLDGYFLGIRCCRSDGT